jgi:hypothetical protein
MAIDIQSEQTFIGRNSAIKKIKMNGILESEESNGLGDILDNRVADLLQ